MTPDPSTTNPRNSHSAAQQTSGLEHMSGVHRAGPAGTANDPQACERKNDVLRERYLRALCAHYKLPIEVSGYRESLRHDFGGSRHDANTGRLRSDGDPKRYSLVHIEGGRSAELFEATDGGYIFERTEPVGVSSPKPDIVKKEILETLVKRHVDLAGSSDEKLVVMQDRVAKLSDNDLTTRLIELINDGAQLITIGDLSTAGLLKSVLGTNLGKTPEGLKSAELTMVVNKLNDRYDAIVAETPPEVLRAYMTELYEAIASKTPGFFARRRINGILRSIKGMSSEEVVNFWSKTTAPFMIAELMAKTASTKMSKALILTNLIERRNAAAEHH